MTWAQIWAWILWPIIGSGLLAGFAWWVSKRI